MRKPSGKLCRKKIDANIRFWQKKLEEVPELLELPSDFPRPAEFTRRGKTHYFPFAKNLQYRLRKLSKDYHISFEEILLASFFVFLYRFSLQSDLCIGSNLHRNKERWKHVIEPLEEITVLREKISGNISFLEWVKQVRKTCKEAKEHAKVSFSKLVARLRVSKNSSFHPMVQLFFSWKEDLPHIVEESLCRFDLSLEGSEEGGRFQYYAEIFSEDTIERLAKNFLCLLENIARNPHKKLDDMALMSQREERKIVITWNQNQTKYPRNSSVVEEFEKIVKKFPHRTALRFKKEELSYQKLNCQVNQLARYLLDRGVQRQEYVGISFDKSIDLIVGILAILKVGAIYLPIDASFPEERCNYFIKDARIKVFLTQKDFLHVFSKKKKLEFLLLEELKEKLASYNDNNLKMVIQPTDIAYVNYTSGTTGLPKGVEVLHRGILRLIKNPLWAKMTFHDRWLQISNISFDATTIEIWGALLNGGCLCIYPNLRLVPKEMADFLEKEKVTQAVFSARFFNLMVDQEIHSLRGLKYLHSVGDTMSVAHTQKAFKALPNVQLLNGYGPTENTTYTCVYRIVDLKSIENGVPIGKAISNTSVYILDHKLKPVPIGFFGEIYTGGDGIARGYLGKKEMTQKKFVPDPFNSDPRAKMYRTGDLGKFLADGNVVFLGRVDSQVKIRGFRIEIGEIEEVVKKMEKVRDAVCIISEEIKGEKQLSLYVVVPKEVKGEKIRKFLESKLPSQIVPDFIITLDKFPVTPTGKIDRRALSFPRKFLVKRKEKPLFLPSSLEEMILELWKKVLKIPHVDKQDNFFHVGGNSINAVEFSSSLSQALKQEIPSTLIFEEPIFENFAKEVEAFSMLSVKEQKGKKIHRDLFWKWRKKEIFLDKEIGQEKLSLPKKSQYTHPKHIFLTGVTGFVGAFFLHTLLEKTEAKIYCLVRAKTDKEGLKRIEAVLDKYWIGDRKYRSRIISVAGDLEKKFFGLPLNIFDNLAWKIDTVFHIGAMVNHILPYDKLKAPNVLGTQEVIRLCLKKKKKPLHFISTIDVFENRKKIKEEADLTQSKHLMNGYAQSKWVAEKIVMLARKRGLLANIYRLSRTIGDSKNGVGPTGDFLWRLIQASIQMHIFPKVDFFENMTPVDFVTDALVHISQHAEWMGMEYHLFSQEVRSYGDIFRLLRDFGYNVKLVSYDKWRDALVKESMKNGEEKLRGMVALFPELPLSTFAYPTIFGFDNLERALKKSSLSCPSIEKGIFQRYLNYFIQIGFLPPYSTKFKRSGRLKEKNFSSKIKRKVRPFPLKVLRHGRGRKRR